VYIQDGKAWSGLWLVMLISDEVLWTWWVHEPSGCTKSRELLGGLRNRQSLREDCYVESDGLRYIPWTYSSQYSPTCKTYMTVMTGRLALMAAAVLQVVKFPIRYTTKKLICTIIPVKQTSYIWVYLGKKTEVTFIHICADRSSMDLSVVRGRHGCDCYPSPANWQFLVWHGLAGYGDTLITMSTQEL
jgi:hypothetical protein